MNEKTTQLIEKLASKLGTTSEYLWNVLVSQAKVDATISLILIVISTAILYGLFRLHKKFVSKMPDSDRSYYYELEELLIVPMILSSIIALIFFTTCLFGIDNIITGYLNPEYWALNEVLSNLK